MLWSSSDNSCLFPFKHIYIFQLFVHRYVAQLYYLITKIKWEYDTQPNILKGGNFFSSEVFQLFCSDDVISFTQLYADVLKMRWPFPSLYGQFSSLEEPLLSA